MRRLRKIPYFPCFSLSGASEVVRPSCPEWLCHFEAVSRVTHAIAHLRLFVSSLKAANENLSAAPLYLVVT